MITKVQKGHFIVRKKLEKGESQIFFSYGVVLSTLIQSIPASDTADLIQWKGHRIYISNFKWKCKQNMAPTVKY